MKKTAAIIIVLLVIIGGVTYALIHKSKNTTDMSNMSNSNSSNSSNSSSSPVATNSVSIENFAFSPAAITVKKGTTVTWTNKDNVPHTVTETDGQTGPGSQSLENGQTYTFTFSTAGTFHYHCSIHSGMTGTVTVTE